MIVLGIAYFTFLYFMVGGMVCLVTQPDEDALVGTMVIWPFIGLFYLIRGLSWLVMNSGRLLSQLGGSTKRAVEDMITS